MSYINNHYIPQFILRRFADKINRYNVKTDEIRLKRSPRYAFSSKNIYPEWLEHMLSNLESKMTSLLDHNILKAEEKVTLTREENYFIKKFFAIATLRTPHTLIMKGVKHIDDVERLKKDGFKEVEIENETNEEYAYRTMKVILESNELNEVYNHPQVTYEACKWITMFNNCYIAIWDSADSKEDFIITDNGMNCEHDKSRFKLFNNGSVSYFNERDEMIKRGYVFKKIIENESKNPLKCLEYYVLMNRMNYVHANYYLFAVSNTRTIALINPFFRLYDQGIGYDGPLEVPNVYPTLISREAIKCNTQTYKKIGEYHKDDLFHYEIKNLPVEDVIIINNMMLDRVFEWVGFTEFSRVCRSLNVYSLVLDSRNKYNKLIEYLVSLGYDFPKTKKYIDLSNKLVNAPFSDAEMECINLFMNNFDIQSS